jgi:hypothetical protein
VIWLGNGAATIVLATGDGYDTIKNFQLGLTKLQIGRTDNLTFADSGEGAQILQGEDLLAVVTWQTAGTLSGNISQVFTVPT